MIADQYAEAYNRELQGILQRAYDDAAAQLEDLQQDIDDAEERVARACQAIRDISTESCVAQVQAYSYLCGSVVTLGTALTVEAPPVAVAIGGTGGHGVYGLPGSGTGPMPGESRRLSADAGGI